MFAGFRRPVHIATWPRDGASCAMVEHSVQRYETTGTTPRRAFVPRRAARRFARLALVGVGFATAVGAAAQSGAAEVYRCVEATGRVLYADYPCKGGARVDIRPGAPAPDASQQLARARDELDRSAARRAAADEAAALQREALYLRQRELDATRNTDIAAYSPDLSYLPAYGFYPPYARVDRPKARPLPERPHAEPRRVPVATRPR